MTGIEEDAIDRDLSEIGLSSRGGFVIGEDEDLYSQNWRSLVMIGNLGGRFWQYFDRRKYGHYDNPLDSWTKDILTPIGNKYGGKLVYPFEGPPYYPFIVWAIRSEGLSNSPLGMLMHPQYGLWHAYRGALLLEEECIFKVRAEDIHPCDTCLEKPCLRACPVGAFKEGSEFDVKSCRDYMNSSLENDCMDNGCKARKACMIGVEYQFGRDQLRHHNLYFSGRHRSNRRRNNNL